MKISKLIKELEKLRLKHSDKYIVWVMGGNEVMIKDFNVKLVKANPSIPDKECQSDHIEIL